MHRTHRLESLAQHRVSPSFKNLDFPRGAGVAFAPSRSPRLQATYVRGRPSQELATVGTELRTLVAALTGRDESTLDDALVRAFESFEPEIVGVAS